MKFYLVTEYKNSDKIRLIANMGNMNCKLIRLYLFSVHLILTS